jgi:hypothetical protein
VALHDHTDGSATETVTRAHLEAHALAHHRHSNGLIGAVMAHHDVRSSGLLLGCRCVVRTHAKGAER